MHHSLKCKPRLALNFSVINVVYSDMHTNRRKHSLLLSGHRIKQWSALHLGWPEAERCGLDVSLLFVHQQQRLVVCQTEILPCRHVSKSERLTPANVTATPSGHRVSQWHQHTELLQIHSKQNWDNKEKEKMKGDACLWRNNGERNCCKMKLFLYKPAKKCALWM